MICDFYGFNALFSFTSSFRRGIRISLRHTQCHLQRGCEATVALNGDFYPFLHSLLQQLQDVPHSRSRQRSLQPSPDDIILTSRFCDAGNNLSKEVSTVTPIKDITLQVRLTGNITRTAESCRLRPGKRWTFGTEQRLEQLGNANCLSRISTIGDSIRWNNTAADGYHPAGYERLRPADRTPDKPGLLKVAPLSEESAATAPLIKHTGIKAHPVRMRSFQSSSDAGYHGDNRSRRYRGGLYRDPPPPQQPPSPVFA